MLKLELTLLLAGLAFPASPASSSLLPAAVARLVSAARVEDTLVAVFVAAFGVLAAVEVADVAALAVEAALEEFRRLVSAELWPVETPLIDIMSLLARSLERDISAAIRAT